MVLFRNSFQQSLSSVVPVFLSVSVWEETSANNRENLTSYLHMLYLSFHQSFLLTVLMAISIIKMAAVIAEGDCITRELDIGTVSEHICLISF